MTKRTDADWGVLLPPYEFKLLPASTALVVRVVRFEVGLAQRDIRQPPYSVWRPTLRLHVPPEDKPGRPPYWDWMAAGLIQRILALYNQAIDDALQLPIAQLVAQLEALSPARPRPLPLKITRHVDDGETEYAVELGEVT